MNKEKIPNISLFGLISVILFIVLSLTARALYPFGDEPDFTVRAPSLIFSEHSWWLPYYWLSGLLSQLDYTSNCIINSTPLSLTQEIDRTTCTQDIWQIVLRLIITVTVAMPLFLAVTFRKNFVSLTKLLGYKISHAEWNERLNILSLTLVFPGFIYFFGVLAEEQYVLMLSILIFLLWGNIYILVFLLFLIAAIDIGNFLVVSYFAALLFSLDRIINKVKLLYILFAFLLLTITFAVLNFYVIEQLSNIAFISEKTTSIIDAYQDSDVINKYPIYLRPAITAMSLVLFTPAYVKSLLAYIILFLIVFYTLLIYKNQFSTSYKSKYIAPLAYIELKTKTAYFTTAFVSIITLIVILPNYSNGKYYIFLMPFLLLPYYKIYKKESMLKFMVLINIIIFTNIAFYYL